ncbi:hypothetical protein D3C84_953410 [compost metagenome]
MARPLLDLLFTSPMPSTWPETRWPPRRELGISAFSRFTGSPTLASAKPVRESVSRETSAV